MVNSNHVFKVFNTYYVVKTEDGINSTGETLEFTPYVQQSPNLYSGMAIYSLSDATFKKNNGTITFIGYRKNPTNSAVTGITAPLYNETITINSSLGSINATATYTDYGTGIETTIKQQEFMITATTGKYISFKRLIIYYDNDGKQTGRKGARIIEFYP